MNKSQKEENYLNQIDIGAYKIMYLMIFLVSTCGILKHNLFQMNI